MSESSAIEWTDATWNPVRGCTKVSPGCAHCYAASFAERWRGIPGHPYEQGFDLRLATDKLHAPLSWSRARRIFVNSMSDLFHEGVPTRYIDDVFRVMELADWHTYQVLTKRADRLMQVLDEIGTDVEANGHIWIGVSVENRKHGLSRIDALRTAPVAVRFLSIEPLLEDLGVIDLSAIDWVIVGGESGPGARPMRREWVESIRAQCRAAEVPFFFKQWGGVRKAATGRMLDGRTFDETPERPARPVPSKSERDRRRNTVNRESGNLDVETRSAVLRGT